MFSTRRMSVVAIVLSGACSSALAQQVETRSDLSDILTDTEQIEDLEGVSLHAGGTIVVANPLNSDTAASFLAIQPGVTYSSPVELRLHAGFTIGVGEDNVLWGTDRLDIAFDEPQRAVGLDIAVGSEPFSVVFSDVVGELGRVEFAGVAGGFAGWQDWGLGITSVSITHPTGGVVSADDVAWGRAVPPCAADFAPPTGALDFSDIIAFLTAFTDTEDAADLAVPFGVWDFSDVVQYLSAFAAGCP